MTPDRTPLPALDAQAIVDSVVDRVMAHWPLDQWVAVDPLWHWKDQSLPRVSALLSVLRGESLLMPRTWYHEQWQAGRFDQGHLHQALKANPESGLSTTDCLTWLAGPDDRPLHRIVLMPERLRTAQTPGASHPDVVDDISDFLADWVEQQAEPDTSALPASCHGQLYADWLEAQQGKPAAGQSLSHLPTSANALLDTWLPQVSRQDAAAAEHLALALLLSVYGWASRLAWTHWPERRNGDPGCGDASLVRELLAVRLAAEISLLEQYPEVASQAREDLLSWHTQWYSLPHWIDATQTREAAGWICQAAWETAYRNTLQQRLTQQTRTGSPAPPEMQLAFCIDVRSEPLRRALEAQSDRIETRGCAGSFGLTLHHRDENGRFHDRVPALLTPEFDKNGSGDILFQGQPLDLETRAGVCRKALQAMGFAQDYADTVILVGHTGEAPGRTYASALHCGACGGHSGEMHAETLALWLNESAVRQALHRQGYSIPESTRFYSALHNTTRQTIEPGAGPALPDHQQQWLRQAEKQLRQTRPSARPAAATGSEQDQRAQAWSELRAEWGLAGNRVFIGAPGYWTRQMNLHGEAFLHEYWPERDPDGSQLERVLAGPVAVGYWINAQYHWSTAAHELFSSGDKTRHQMVGDRQGVRTQGKGDLRIGLPWQSLHNGRTWQHTPARLEVVLATTPAALIRALRANASMRRLVMGGWAHFWAWPEPGQNWVPVRPEDLA